MASLHQAYTGLLKHIRDYPQLLAESARNTPPLRSSMVLLLIMSAVTSVPAIAHETSGVPNMLVYLYVFLFPASIFGLAVLTAVFTRFVFLPVIRQKASLKFTYGIILSLTRHLVYYAIILLSLSVFWLLYISETGVPNIITAAMIILAVCDFIAHLSAMAEKPLVWGTAAAAIFVVLYVPAYYVIIGVFWSPTFFDVAIPSDHECEAISIDKGSVVLFDHFATNFAGIDRFTPVRYKNRGRGLEMWMGRVYGLPDERLEIDGGNVYSFDSSNAIVKPESVQDKLWITVALEDFAKGRSNRGWDALTNDWLFSDGNLRVNTKDKTLLVFSPNADRSAFKLGRGVTDLEIVAAPEHFTCPDSGDNFPISPSNFELERTKTETLNYWGVNPKTGSKFCARCGTAKDSFTPIKDKRISTCSQCGAKLGNIKPPIFQLRGGLNPVYDIRIEMTLALRSQKGKFFIRYMYHDIPLMLHVDGDTGIIKLVRVGNPDELVLPKPAKLNSPLSLSLACYDGNIEVAAGDYVATIPVDVDLATRPPFDLTLGAENGSFTINDLKISRDQFFTSSAGLYTVGSRAIAKVPVSSYFLLNDRGQSMEDSRTYGCIRKDDIVGTPVMILWPLFR